SCLLRCVTNTISTNDSSGRNMMVAATPMRVTRSALHQVELIDLDRAPLSVDRNDDGEADGCFGGGLGDDENREHLSRQLLVGNEVARERHHQQVDAIQHQFDRQQNPDGVPSRQHAVHAERKQNAAEHEKMAEPGNEKFHQSSRAITMAPMRATVNSSDAIS